MSDPQATAFLVARLNSTAQAFVELGHLALARVIKEAAEWIKAQSTLPASATVIAWALRDKRGILDTTAIPATAKRWRRTFEDCDVVPLYERPTETVQDGASPPDPLSKRES